MPPAWQRVPQPSGQLRPPAVSTRISSPRLHEIRSTTSDKVRCRRSVAAAAQQQYCIPPPPGAQDAEPVEWTDSATDKAFIAMCRKAYGALAGWQSEADWDDGPTSYRGMIEVSRALMKGKTAAQQRDAVIAGFPAVPPWFRRLFPYSKWGAELNALITPTFFSWLVGPMQRIEVEADGGVTQRSGVHIQRCRYLAESGCVGMCVNLCKSPTQSFFTEQLGMPLTMEPSFEDYSCRMTFGKRPPPLADDEAAQQPCLTSCPSAQRNAAPHGSPRPCHKLLGFLWDTGGVALEIRTGFHDDPRW